MPIQILPYENRAEGIGKRLNAGLSDIAGGFATLSDRYADMRKQKQQEEHQSKLKQLEYAFKGQQEQGKREYETQQEQEKQRRIQEQNRTYNTLLYGNRGSGGAQGQLGEGQQQSSGGFGPNLPQGERNQQPMGDPAREHLINAIQGANLSQEEGSKILKEYDDRKIEEQKLAETRRGHDISEHGQILKQQEGPRADLDIWSAKTFSEGAKSPGIQRDLKKIIKLAQTGNAQPGIMDKALEKVGLNFWSQGAERAAFDKIASGIGFDILGSVAGANSATSSLFEQVMTTLPNLLQTPEGQVLTAELKINQERIKAILSKNLEKIRDKSPHMILPLNAREEAYRMSQEDIDKISDESYKLIEDVAGDSGFEDMREGQAQYPRSRKESMLGKAGRNAAAVGANIVSGLGGVPSSFLETAKGISSLGDKAGEALNEYINPNLKKDYEALGIGEQGNKSAVTEGLGKLSSVVPGSSRIKEEQSKLLPEGTLQSRNSFEKAVHETAEDIGAAIPSLILNPVGGVKEFAKQLAKSNIPQNVVKFLARSMGAGEGVQDTVKAATMLMTSLDLGDSIFTKSKKDYERLSNNLPKVKMAAPEVEKAAEKLEHWATTGDKKLPSQKAVIDYLESFKEAFGGGRVDPKELLRFKQGLGDRISTEWSSNKRSSALPPMYELRDALTNQIEKWAPGLNEVSSIYSQGKRAQEANDFLADTLTNKYGKKFQEAWLNPKAWYKIGKTYGGSIPINKIVNQLEGISSSPAYRKAWFGMMKYALERNASGVTKNFERILKEKPDRK